jgi:bifunctional DNase/RNase
MALKPCFLSHIVLEEQNEQQVIFLTEKDGSRRIPITIGPLEAMAIDRAVKNTKFPRPLTHDLIITIIEAASLRCREVRIVDLREATFFAEVVLIDGHGKETVVDCRPSDAIALLVRMPGTPLLIEDSVLDDAGN